MTEIKLTKRYPHSRTEDITDAFMRGYEQGKKDGLKVGKKIVLGAFETYITADRKTEPLDKDINVRSKTEPSFTATDFGKGTITRYKDEPQTEECPFYDAIPCEWVCTEYGKCKYKPKTKPQKWETPPKFEHKGIITTCVSVPLALIEDELQTEVRYSDRTDYQGANDYVTQTEPQTDCSWK